MGPEPVSTDSPQIYDLVIGDRGRLVLPAAARRQLGLEQGTPVRLFVDGDNAWLQSRAALAESGIGLYQHLVPAGGAVESFIADRHADDGQQGLI